MPDKYSIQTESRKQQYCKAPRYSWNYYCISKDRYKQLTEYIRSGRYAALAHLAARTANESIADHILLSVTKKLSFEGLERLWNLKKIERMTCGRLDFYGYRRYFYYLFDQEIKAIESSRGKRD